MVGGVDPFLVLVALVALQRVLELRLARHNAKRVLAMGGLEAGAGHYPLLIALHVSFFVMMVVERQAKPGVSPGWWPAPFGVFAAAQALRLWSIRSLGVFWNTRILVLPGQAPVRRGPYRLVRHPNYLAVAAELCCLPLVGGAYFTALAATLLNAVAMAIRIPAENEALRVALSPSSSGR